MYNFDQYSHSFIFIFKPLNKLSSHFSHDFSLKSNIISPKIEASFGCNASACTICCYLILSDRVLKYVSDGSRLSIEYEVYINHFFTISLTYYQK
jgi:hypothetical protein